MTSTSNLLQFKPTYLYIKQHTITGKLYFGKTIQDVHSYLGSGTIWMRHIKKHGIEHVVTLWYELFTNQEELTAFALQFSKEMNIVESSQWANLIPENGLDGGVIGIGYKRTNETKIKISIALTGRKQTEEHKINATNCRKGYKHSLKTKLLISQNQKWSLMRRIERGIQNIGNTFAKGHKVTDEMKALYSKNNKGRIMKKVTCPHCGKIGGGGAMKQYHFDNCKLYMSTFKH